jgi:hypothetical protein
MSLHVDLRAVLVLALMIAAIAGVWRLSDSTEQLASDVCASVAEAHRYLNERADAQREYLAIVIAAPHGVPQEVQDAAKRWTGSLDELGVPDCG